MDSASNELTLSAVANLLGDPAAVATVDEWKAAVTNSRLNDVQAGTIPGKSRVDLLYEHFEYACAHLYDANLLAAIDSFQALARLEKDGSVLKSLAYLGLGRALTLLRRFPRAAASLTKGREKALASRTPLLIALGDTLLLLNASDWGRDAESSLVASEERPSTRIEPLLRTYDTLARARHLLRSSSRNKALGLVEDCLERCHRADREGERRPTIGPIPHGLLLRTRGILNAVLGKGVGARKDFEDAIGIFESARFRLGVVQTALSLAEVTVPVDRRHTEVYLLRAEEILSKDVDAPNVSRLEGRQMPGEQAKLHSRKARLYLSMGKIDAALREAERDVECVGELSAGPEDGVLTRAQGHAYRTLGRVLACQRRVNEALRAYQTSVRCFEAVRDGANGFFSQVHQCDLLLESDWWKGAGTVLDDMERTLVALEEGTQERRDKERCIVTVLRSVYRARMGDAEEVLSDLRQARRDLKRFGRDYYYAASLVAEARVLMMVKDNLVAAQTLREARRCAISLEVEPFRQTIQALLQVAGDDGRKDAEPHGELPRTILFADMRGFTKACKHLPVERMAVLIEEFAELVCRCTTRYGGRPIRFLGDCVMAVFSGEEGEQAREMAAMRAVCEMYQQFEGARHRWLLRELKPRALEYDVRQLGLGFGLATGKVVAGDFGSGELFEYSVIGEAVNVASRLQGNADDGEVLMCRETAAVFRAAAPGVAGAARAVEAKGLGTIEAFGVRVPAAVEVLERAHAN